MWRFLTFFAAFLLCAVLVNCREKQTDSNPSGKQSAKKWNRSNAETEYQLVQAELKLVRSKQSYLVFNFPRKELELRLYGAIVWNYPLEIIDVESDATNEFVNRFMGEDKRFIRTLSDKFLFAAQKKSSDSILKIVSEVVRAKVDLMQRQVPERFQLLWDGGLIVEVRTDVVGKPRSKLKNAIFQIRQTLQRPLGEALLVIRMDPERALTLYRVAQRGLPTLIYPVK